MPHLAALNAASMGPWLRSHGRKENRIPPKDSAWLQWGRGFAATEGRLSRERVYPARSPASMGPWLRSHGRLPAAVGTPPRQMLQWGRGFAATEGVDCRQAGIVKTSFNGAVASQPRKVPLRWCPPAWHEPSLQWGRGFAATEGSTGRSRSRSPSSFNGAVASQPRKVG